MNKILIRSCALIFLFCITETAIYAQERANARRIVNHSRSVHEMDTVFPFDIRLKNIEGEEFSSAEVLENDGKPVVLAFWLTTCPPCRSEMRNIKPHYEKWIKETGVKVVFISTDFEHNSEKIKTFIQDKNYDYEVYHDFNREFRKVLPGGLNGLPQCFLIDDTGDILYHKRKYMTGDEFKLYDAMKASVTN